MVGNVISLLTDDRGGRLTGGHLYNQRMIAAAGERGLRVDIVSVRGLSNPLRRAEGLVLVDSLVAWRVAIWAALGPRDQELVAMVHQRPGGVEGSPLRRALRRALDLSLYRRCRLLIAASTGMSHELADVDGIEAQRIRVAEPGSDLDAKSSSSPDLRAGRRISVLAVANWLPNKGILELLEAVASLPEDRVHLHLVGDVTMRPRYARSVEERMSRPDLTGRVVSHGHLPPERLAALYSQADVFTLLGRDEAYGTVVGEALAAGVPVVAWRSGNLPSLVEDGVTGCLLPPGDIEALTETLGRLATEPVWRETLAANARRRGRSLPTWDQTADLFFDALGATARIS